MNEYKLFLTHSHTFACSVLTSVTAGTVGSSCIHTGGTGVVTQVTLATRLVLALGTLHHAAALIQSPAAHNNNNNNIKINLFNNSIDMNYV